MNNNRAMVIVGAGEAGTAAAIALREVGWRGRVILTGNEAMLPYERPPLSKALLVEEVCPGPKFLLTPERLADLAIEYLEGRNVEAIDRDAHTITFSDGEQLAYERLLLATGAHPRRLNIPITKGSTIVTLRTYTDALTVRRAIRPGCALVIVGGGFIGLEVAASAVSKGASVTVLEAGWRLLMRAVPSSIAALIRAKHEGAGVCVQTNAMVVGIEAIAGKSKVILADGRTHLADLVLIGVGALPSIKLAQAAGLAVENGIAADDTLATSDPYVFAAGDCCSFIHRLYGKRLRLEVWRNAWQQGVAAAANMLGANSPYESVPWFWSDQYDDTLQIAGLCSEGNVLVTRKLGAKGLLSFYLNRDGRLIAACGFGSVGAFAKEIRFAEAMIGMRLTPDAGALSDPAVNLKSIVVQHRVSL